ncbi:MAG: glycosyltransferase, partial [Acidimicrobiia bacterium]|nr:glycosyltransferase [Acidimicrobiia bacterium]
LVVSSVHPPDDPRIREKTIGSLQTEWDVTYATRLPGPTSKEGITWLALRGGRMARLFTASMLILSRTWDVVSVHDPELLPAALVRSLLGRSTVFDLHEDVPAQMLDKSWIPSPLRRPLAWTFGMMLRVSERAILITVAEDSYGHLLSGSPAVIRNHLNLEGLPPPVSDTSEVAYLGDITKLRGASAAVAFARGAGLPLVMVGRRQPELQRELESIAGSDVAIEFTGHLDHESALARVATATVGVSPLHDVGNYSHSMPTKVLEYLALGVGAVVSDLPGTRSVVEGLPGVAFVRPGDDAAWEEAGHDLDLRRLREEARSGVEEVRSRFAWPDDEVRDVYRRAFAG